MGAVRILLVDDEVDFAEALRRRLAGPCPVCDGLSRVRELRRDALAEPAHKVRGVCRG